MPQVLKTIAYLEELLANRRRCYGPYSRGIVNLKTKFGDARRTEISDQGEVEFHEEDLIPHARVVVTLSNRGFVKRIPAPSFILAAPGREGHKAWVPGRPTPPAF